MKHSLNIRSIYWRSLVLVLSLATTLLLAQETSAPSSERTKAPKAKADSAKQATRRALREAEHEIARARREAELAPELAGEDWEALAEVPWPVIHESMELAREAMDMAQAQLHNFDFAELNEHMAELAFTLPPHGGGPVGVPPIPPMPVIPPIPPIAPMVSIPNLENCKRGWVIRGFFHPSREYESYLSEDERLRITALSALINQDENAALGEIKSIIAKNQNWAMRASSIELLACLEDSEAVLLLRDVLHNESDQRVRLAAVRALSHIDSPEAREALQELLKK
ncbi:MAG: HEAT repeat domain-containing protein [bacterium]